MTVVIVNFGGVGGHKISDSLGVWLSCDEQKERKKDLFLFDLHWTMANLCRGYRSDFKNSIGG